MKAGDYAIVLRGVEKLYEENEIVLIAAVDGNDVWIYSTTFMKTHPGRVCHIWKERLMVVNSE